MMHPCVALPNTRAYAWGYWGHTGQSTSIQTRQHVLSLAAGDNNRIGPAGPMHGAPAGCRWIVGNVGSVGREADAIGRSLRLCMRHVPGLSAVRASKTVTCASATVALLLHRTCMRSVMSRAALTRTLHVFFLVISCSNARARM